MTAAAEFNDKVPRPSGDGAKGNHLKRRSSLQKIMHIYNQGCSAFPHLFIRLQDVHSTVRIDIAKQILFLRPFLLHAAVAASVATIVVQLLLCCVVAYKYSFPNGPFFLTCCIFVLGVFAFSCFKLPPVKRLQRSLSCRMKMD